jgi:hypothetical protein
MSVADCAKTTHVSHFGERGTKGARAFALRPYTNVKLFWVAL